MKSQLLMLLALGLTIGCAPMYAQSVETVTHSTEIVNPSRVVDSWMQPAAVRTTQVTDQSGETRVRQEPLIMERHERVVIPIVKQETTTTFTQTPKQTIKRTFVASKPYRSSYKARKRVASVRRKAPVRVAVAPRRRAIASTSMTTTTQSMIVERRDRVVETPIIIERRHPALDLH